MLLIEPVLQAVAPPGDDFDQQIARQVIDGRLDGGNVPARAWDTEGVRALRALNAPLLVTSEALVADIVTGDLAPELLAGLDGTGRGSPAAWTWWPCAAIGSRRSSRSWTPRSSWRSGCRRFSIRAMIRRHRRGCRGTSDDEKTIRTQIERWAQAVHRGDMDAVLADRSADADIVMFDVPPPQDGVRGIDAYRATWPPFFAWQASGAVFEVMAAEVTAGVDVAFAHALLRCGTPDELAAHPDNRLRVTFGLRREGGRWRVTHEHHSFPDASPTYTAQAPHQR